MFKKDPQPSSGMSSLLRMKKTPPKPQKRRSMAKNAGIVGGIILAGVVGVSAALNRADKEVKA